ncbi:MAG: MAPEG family protein [Henriciella sp.]
MTYQLGDLLPVLALIVWTLVMWIWMYATRIPAMQKAKINPDDARHPGSAYADKIPASTRSVADNYNHLHEQPTIFYAMVFFAALTGGSDNLFTWLAWAYVILRVIHSFVQVMSPKVTQRFLVFSLSSIVLMVMAGKEVIRVLTSPALGA